jgi:RHS repeat-associated protein
MKFGTTNYLYDGMNTLEEVDTSGNVLAQRTRSRRARRRTTGAAAFWNNQLLPAGRNLLDHIIDQSRRGAHQQLHVRCVWKTDRVHRNAGESVPICWPRVRSETGIYQYRMRYYDPNAGRFLSEDPTGFNGGDYNLYAYVLNSPTELVDPLGLGHMPGGPKHPPLGVPFRCNGGPNRTQGDSCDVIMAKMAFIAAMMADHALWDMEQAGTRHSCTDKPNTDMDSLTPADAKASYGLTCRAICMAPTGERGAAAEGIVTEIVMGRPPLNPRFRKPRNPGAPQVRAR